MSHADEESVTAPTTAELVQRLAELKGESVIAMLEPQADTLLIACDSLLEFEGMPYGKPLDDDDIRARWRMMRRGEGVLHTGHFVVRLRGQQQERLCRLASTVVRFADLTDDDIEAYIATGEPQHVAGAFTTDGFGGAFVTSVEGDYHNVVGLSLPLIRTMVTDLGVDWTSLWTTPKENA